MGLLGLIYLQLNGLCASERTGSPALVNPALRSPLRPYLTLDGDWTFATDPAGVGEAHEWFRPKVPLPKARTIQVPGCWEAQGVGEPGNSVSVAPERSIRPLRSSYNGTGWYRKEVTVPQGWAHRQVWLKFGGVNAQGWFWVNGTYLGHNDCYCGTYKYNITDLVQPGSKLTVAVKVRNDVPSRKGLMNWIQRFGGLYRSVELEATPAVFIDNASLVGDLDRQACVVHVRLAGTGPDAAAPVEGQLQVNVATLSGICAGTTNLSLPATLALTNDLAIPIALRPCRPWSPEEPNLYRADIILKRHGQALDGWTERFGVRKWEVRGGDFYLNNSKYFVRGYGDDYIYPLTIVSPASRETHRQHLELAKSYGFAYVRHHTHCELPEFYEAADEVGIMIQPELPYYGAKPSAAAAGYFHPKEDLAELSTQYGRYVSLATYCTGNEGHLGSPLDHEVYAFAKQLDPTRLALHQDGGHNTKDNADFHQGPSIPWQPGSQDASWPFTAHEYLNLATQEDPRLAGRYTGALRPPVRPEDFRAELARTGLSWDWGVATLEAGNQLQRVYQKRGLEQARLDPACDGYIYWTIVDVGSPAAQGLFNQFWQPKASRAEYFKQFNSPTVLLARFSPIERILQAGEALQVEWWISAFQASPVRGQTVAWHLEQADKNVAAGELPPVDAEVGEVKVIGSTRIEVPESAAPAKLRLVAELRGTTVRNSWDLWVFPRPKAALEAGKGLAATPRLYEMLKDRYPGLREIPSSAAEAKPAGAPPELLLADQFDRSVTNALAEGSTVLLLRLPGEAPGVELGWWAISKQAGTAIAHHPAFGQFPHDGYLNELWFHLLDHTVSATDAGLRQVEPLMVGRGSAGYLLHVFQARAGGGNLLASGLNLLPARPEAAYLLDQFIQYARSSRFQPQGTLDLRHPGACWEGMTGVSRL